MKAQTKMVVSLAVVCALAITTISGATYAWLSDSENSEIHVNVGKVDVSMDVSGFKLLSLGVDRTERGTFDNGGTAEVVKDEGGKAVVNISKATPGDAVQFTLTMYNSSTISHKFLE